MWQPDRHPLGGNIGEIFMKQINLFIISLILFNVSFAFSQDIRATTKDGQAVILRKNGNWFFYNPLTNTGQKNKLPDEGTIATAFNGQIVILKKDGTWIMTNTYQTPNIL